MHTHTQHTHNTHTHNGHPFSFLLGWGCLFFAALGSCDPNCDDSTQKCCSSSRGNRPLDRRDGRPTNSANSRPGEKKKKKKKKIGKNGKHFSTGERELGGPAQAQKHNLHLPTRTGTQFFDRPGARPAYHTHPPCISLAVWPIYLFICGSSLLPKTDTHFFFFLIMKHSKSIKRRRKGDRIFVQFIFLRVIIPDVFRHLAVAKNNFPCSCRRLKRWSMGNKSIRETG